MVKRYDLSYVIKCEFCSKKQKEGKIEMFKKDIIVDMLADEKTWETFRRYCLDNKTLQDLPKDLQKLVKEREKKNFENKTAQRMAQKPGKTRSRRRNHRTHLHVIGKHPKNKLEEIEKVKPHSDYLGKHQDLGINRPKNIKYRLKEGKFYHQNCFEIPSKVNFFAQKMSKNSFFLLKNQFFSKFFSFLVKKFFFHFFWIC